MGTDVLVTRPWLISLRECCEVVSVSLDAFWTYSCHFHVSNTRPWQMVRHLEVLDLNPLDPQMVNKIKSSSLTETQPPIF